MKHLIFDFNGTVVSDLPLVYELIKTKMTSRGVNLDQYGLEYLRDRS